MFKNKLFIIFEICILLCVSLIPLLWFVPNHMVIGYDSGYPIEFIPYFQQRLYTWLGSQAFGLDTTLWLGQIFLLGLLAVVRLLGFGIYDVQKITFVFWFFAMSVSMYTLVLYLFNKRQQIFIRLCSVFFYVINFFLFSFWIQGEQTTFSVYALLPLVVVLLLQFYHHKRSVFGTAMISNIVFLFFNAGGVIGFPLLGAVIIAGLVVSAFYALESYRKSTLKVFITRFVLLMSLGGGIFIFLNAYWLLPFVRQFFQHYATQVGIAGGVEAAISWTKFISGNASFTNLVRLQGDINWINSGFYFSQYTTNPILILISFLFPLLSFSAFWFVRSKEEKKLVVLLFCIAGFGIFFASGTHAPFGSLYIFLMERVPGFVAFRSGYYKFVPLIYMTFSMLMSLSLFYITSKVERRFIREGLRLIIIICIFIYHFPFFNNQNFTFGKPFSSMLTIPDYVREYGKVERNRSEYYRTLVVPPLNNYTLSTYSWNYWGPPVFNGLSDKPTVLNLTANLNQSELYLVNSIYQSLRDENFELFFTLSNLLDIHSITLTKDTAVDFQQFPTESPDVFEAKLRKSNLFRIAWEKGPWVLYTWEDTPKSKKIFTTNTITQYENFFTNNIDPLLLDANNFVLSEHVAPLSKILPIQRSIQFHTCISCLISYANYNSDILLPYSRINPTSFLYPLKNYLEAKRNTRTSGQSSDTYIGLSLKRLAEIQSFAISISQGKKYSANEIEEWASVMNIFYTYWAHLHDSIIPLKESGDYSALLRIYRHAEFEKNILLSIYSQLSMESLRQIPVHTVNSLWKIDGIRKDLKEIFDEHNLGHRFMYATKTQDVLYMDTQSLPKDRSGEPLSNINVEGEGVSTRLEATGSSLPIVQHPKDVTKIYYPDAIERQEIKNIAVVLPNKSYECISSIIKDFAWTRRYVISAEYSKNENDTRVFIKFKKHSIPTVTDSNSYFIPDQSIEIGDDAGIFTRVISGNNNDIGAEILFCSEYLNPDQIFKNIRIYEYKPPVVFSSKNMNVADIAPTVSFQRINPTEYIVSIKDAHAPYVLGFLERFSPQWQATFVDTNMPVNDELYHFVMNGYANAWHIKREGTYSIRLRFESQKMFKIGIGISAFSIVVLVVSYGLFVLKKIWKRN